MLENKIKGYKEEFEKRYIYLYENASFILAPFMNENNQKELYIYLKKPDDNTLQLLEEILLCDIRLEETRGYQLFESLKNDKEYLEKYKNGLLLLERKNAKIEWEKFKEKLNIWKILVYARKYIEEQSGDLNNKEKKLNVLDEYFRIYRYRNDGKIWTSGFQESMHDITENYTNYSYSAIIFKDEHKPSRDKKDIGITNNSFINYFSKLMPEENNCSHFTEDEKQEIYLMFHDELPWNLEVTCTLEEEYIPTMIETRLTRPENTNFCGKNFYIKEEEIFVDSNDKLYRYYQLCPHCGCIVNIPKEILSAGVKQRIEERCSKDKNLFRKMFLYSELIALDNLSKDGQRKILKR